MPKQYQKITCPKCAALIEAEMPQPSIVNTPVVCMMVIVPTRATCPGCGTQYFPIIVSARIEKMQWPEVPPEVRAAESNIVLPGPRPLPVRGNGGLR